MNIKLTVLVILVAVCLLVTPGFTTAYKSPDGSLVISAKTVEMYPNKFVATGKAHVKRYDPIGKTTLNADAEKIVVVMLSEKGKNNSKKLTAAGSIKKADMCGPVKIVYETIDASGAASKIIALADNADFESASNLAHLVGHVQITNDDPVKFAAPAVMVGDKATVNLAPNLGPEDFRFRVESSPGVSSFTVTPKAKDN